MIDEIIQQRRSIRRFKNERIPFDILKKIVECGRLYPSRGNKQPLKFILIDNQELCDNIFKNILWGSKVSGYKVFNDNRYSPKAYIIVLVDNEIMPKGYEYELGASIENMLLCATENDIGSVWIKSINSNSIKKELEINNENINIDSIIALGYAAHKSKIVDMTDDTKTIIDEHLNLQVPKRDRKDIIFYNKYGN